MKKEILFLIVVSLLVATSSFPFQSEHKAVFPFLVSGQVCRLSITPVSNSTFRLTLLPVEGAGPGENVNSNLILVARKWPPPAFSETGLAGTHTIKAGNFRITLSTNPLTLEVSTSSGRKIQHLVFDPEAGNVTFRLGDGPLLGLGGGGQQFDRRGLYDPMDNGHRAGEYQIYGSRVPIPFLISTEGWALFFHRPYNAAIDLRNDPGIFIPKKDAKEPQEKPLPMDIFVIAFDSPEIALSEYINLTGRPAMPPKWALGYIQSHRTLAGPEEVLSVAETFRRKQLPCDALIYLGTGYCPSGWNLGHGSLEFNPKTFDKPQEIINRLHDLHFHVILHVNNPPKTLHGEFPPRNKDESPDHIANYWEKHQPVFSLGVDGWWPDDGDELPIDARLTRHLIYFQGPLAARPGKRPFSLHRTGYAGMQRFGGWVWSGDTFSLWDTLTAHISIGINFSLSASPFWGTDIGGFSPTKELTGELYVRWFQFGAFSPIFRSHGRLWHLRLPWGWNTAELGPDEVVPGHKGTAAPDLRELRNPEVEPICSQYLNLRYQLIPYLYTAVREAFDTGMPVMRALWLHYPHDPVAVRCSDQYLWGRDILVAPVTEKGATRRKVYLPDGLWYDYWTNRAYKGKQHVIRYVDLSTMPLYFRAGSIIPFDPPRQYVDEHVDEPMTLRIYTGCDGESILYEDDGMSLDYLEGRAEWIRFTWKDKERHLLIEPGEKSTTVAKLPRTFKILLLPDRISHLAIYSGKKLEIKF